MFATAGQGQDGQGQGVGSQQCSGTAVFGNGVREGQRQGIGSQQGIGSKQEQQGQGNDRDKENTNENCTEERLLLKGQGMATTGTRYRLATVFGNVRRVYSVAVTSYLK